MISWRPQVRTAEPRFYDVSIFKMIMLWVGTLGFYHFYWHYKQWKYEEESGQDVSPILRAIFAPYTAFSLFGRIHDACEVNDTSNNWNPVMLAIGYLVGILSFKIGGRNYWSVGYLTFLPLIPIQLSINELNRKLAPDSKPNTRFRWWQYPVLLLGIPMFALIIAAAFGFGTR